MSPKYVTVETLTSAFRVIAMRIPHGIPRLSVFAVDSIPVWKEDARTLGKELRIPAFGALFLTTTFGIIVTGFQNLLN